mgnify:CR=1 FL=1
MKYPTILLLIFLTWTALTFTYIILTPLIDREIESITQFFISISPSYYALLTVNIISLCSVTSKEFRKGRAFSLLALLLYTFTIDSLRLLFSNPFQTETFKQAKTFIVLKTGFFRNAPEPDSIGDPMIFSSLILVSDMPSFNAVLRFIPTALWILNTLYMYVLVRERLSIDSSYATILSTIYVASTYELYFANRYSLGAPIFVLTLSVLLALCRRPKLSNIIGFILLFASLTLTHAMFALIVLLMLAIMFFIRLVKVDTTKNSLTTTFTVSIIIFFIWYVIAYASLIGPLRAVLNALRDLLYGVETPELVKGFLSATLKSDYLYLIMARIFVFLLILMAPILLLTYLLVKHRLQWFTNKLKRTIDITRALVTTYITLLTLLCVWVWSRFTGSLRPYQALTPIVVILLGYLMMELLEPKELKGVFVLLKFSTVLLALLAPFILWGPNVTYVNFPSRDITMIKILGKYVPVSKEICGVNIGYPERWLLWIYTTRSDIRLRIIADIRVSYHVDMNPLRMCDINVLNGRVLGLNSKYVYTPSLCERLLYVGLQIQEYGYHKVLDCGKFRCVYVR